MYIYIIYVFVYDIFMSYKIKPQYDSYVSGLFFLIRRIDATDGFMTIHVCHLS